MGATAVVEEGACPSVDMVVAMATVVVTAQVGTVVAMVATAEEVEEDTVVATARVATAVVTALVGTVVGMVVMVVTMALLATQNTDIKGLRGTDDTRLMRRDSRRRRS